MSVRTAQGFALFSAGMDGFAIEPLIPNCSALLCDTLLVPPLAIVPGIVRWTVLTLLPVAPPSSMKPCGLTVARKLYDCGFSPLMSIHCHEAWDAYRSPYVGEMPIRVNVAPGSRWLHQLCSPPPV